MRKNKAVIRLAIAIHEHFTCREQDNVVCDMPEATWQRCDCLAHRLRLAQRRGWSLAAARCERDLRATIDTLHGELVGIAGKLDSNNRNSVSIVTVQDIYRDLLGLHDEFDEVSWDRRQETLSVTTKPIELEGIYLGPFQIQLDWGDLLDGHPNNYRVIAVDAHPAASNEGVTHPHVQDETVCEGDGRAPICKALEQGRLFDFFVIVRNLLHTYNSGSPHVALADWHGVTCADCGSSTCEDERGMCTKCESTICDECYCSCSDCGDAYCAECLDRCGGCDEHYCRSCLKRCDKCRDLSCNSCLDEQERCDNCHEEKTEETANEQTDVGNERSFIDSGAEVQPDSVGEAAVPA